MFYPCLEWNTIREQSEMYSYSNFVDDWIHVLSLFDDVEKINKEERLQTAIDTIQNQFGFTTIQKGNSL